MLILGLDLETSSLDTQCCAIREVGLVLWDTELRSPVDIQSFFVKDTESPEYDKWDVCSHLCGITKEMVETYGIDALQAAQRIGNAVNNAEYILAANGNIFDHPVVDSFMGRCPAIWWKHNSTPWMDLIEDVPFPEGCKSRNMMYLCAWHGFLNPFAHRAVTDVLSMFKVFDHYPLADVIAYYKSPWIGMKAMVSFKEKDLAKDCKFWWKPSKKWWCKNVKLCDLESKKVNIDVFPFTVDMSEGKIERD